MDFGLSRGWWALVLRGVLAVLFGVLAALLPGLTFFVLSMLFGAYVFLDGAFALVAAVSGQVPGRHWWALMLEGVVGLCAGMFAFIRPDVAELALLALIAGWAIATGVLEVAAAVRLRRQIRGEWALGVAGALSILFGVLILAVPPVGIVAISLLVGGYALLFGVLLLILGFRLRAWGGTRPWPADRTGQPTV